MGVFHDHPRLSIHKKTIEEKKMTRDERRKRIEKKNSLQYYNRFDKECKKKRRQTERKDIKKDDADVRRKYVENAVSMTVLPLVYIICFDSFVFLFRMKYDLSHCFILFICHKIIK
jgi:hypothetical protein